MPVAAKMGFNTVALARGADRELLARATGADQSRMSDGAPFLAALANWDAQAAAALAQAVRKPRR